MLNEAPGAAVCGAMEAERTPPVRRPARRDARWVGAGAEAMGAEGQVEGDGDRVGQRWGTQGIRDSEWVIGRAIERDEVENTSLRRAEGGQSTSEEA
jgi:hypothetical protein